MVFWTITLLAIDNLWGVLSKEVLHNELRLLNAWKSANSEKITGSAMQIDGISKKIVLERTLLDYLQVCCSQCFLLVDRGPHRRSSGR